MQYSVKYYLQLRWSFGRHVQGSQEKKTTEIRANVDVEKKILYVTGKKDFEVNYQATDCHRESQNGNQRAGEEREDPKKNGWMEGI